MLACASQVVNGISMQACTTVQAAPEQTRASGSPDCALCQQAVPQTLSPLVQYTFQGGSRTVSITWMMDLPALIFATITFAVLQAGVPWMRTAPLLSFVTVTDAPARAVG